MGGDAGLDPAVLLQGRQGASADWVGYDAAHLFFAAVVWIFGSGDGGCVVRQRVGAGIRPCGGLHAPDETTICKFRHLLEQHGLTRRLFELSRDLLEQQGLLVKAGTIVDASIISAPSSTKNQAKQRDPEMKSTKKGTPWYFGMKAHIGTDPQGLVHRVAVTAANVHDATLMEACLHGQEKVIYGDKAYVSKQRKAEAEAQGVQWRVLRKATRTRKLNCADQSFNKKSNRTRARVEHTFGVIKHLWGYRRTRYRGLGKNAAQVYTLVALANFYLARDSLRAPAVAG